MRLGDVKSALKGRLASVASDDRYKQASVLVLLYGREPRIVMTVKPKNLRIHAGEVSFPGGKHEKYDADLLDTALRETREEIGLNVRRDQVIGQLKDVTTLNTGFRITPFVAVLDEILPLSANHEVQEILHIPLGPLLNTIEDDTDPKHRFIREMYTFRHGDRIVWGASARILRQVATLLAEPDRSS